MVKQATIGWAQEKRIKDDLNLAECEDSLSKLYDSEGRGGYQSEDTKSELLRLEQIKWNILEYNAAAWILQSRALWLEKGDDNSQFFHRYAQGRKNAKTIWKLDRQEGEEIKGFY